MSAIYGTTTNDILTGTTDNDYLYVKSGNDELHGDAGQDTLEGDEGNDTLSGDSDRDILRGGVRDDDLFGGEGNDILSGGQRGNHVEVDYLAGGAGQDRFYLGDYHGNYYSQAGDSDYAVINDFELGQDQVVLDKGSYSLSASTILGLSGTAIYSGSELLGILYGVDSSELDFGDSLFTTILSLNGETSISSDVIVEAESLNLEHYEIQDYSSGEQIIGLPEGTTASGTATLLADDYSLSGAYNLSFDYFDENDGQANIEILVNGSLVDTLILDGDPAGGLPDESNRLIHTIEGLVINPGNTLEIIGTPNGTEWARIDRLTFSPVTVETSIGYLTAGVTKTGTLNAENTVDTYSFQLSAAGSLDLDLTAVSGTGDADVRVYRDENGNNYLDSADSLLEEAIGTTSLESIDLNNLAAGDYLIEVESYSADVEYSLGLYVPSFYRFVYEYGNGDYYQGYGYSQPGELDLLAGQTWGNPSQSLTNEAEEYGIYKITEATPITYHLSFAGDVVVDGYYDAASGLTADQDIAPDIDAHLHNPDDPFTPTDTKMGLGSSGLGSENGFVHRDDHQRSMTNVVVEGEYWFDNYYQVDLNV
ncbi:MAG TPA: pre-peptidase C-terminal domain-containing protein [Coleofasciculaceae cyanobacterium]